MCSGKPRRKNLDVSVFACVYWTGVYRHKQSDMRRTQHTKAYRQKIGKKEDEKEDVMVKQVTDATWTEIVWIRVVLPRVTSGCTSAGDDVVCLHWLSGFNPFGSKIPLEVGSGMSLRAEMKVFDGFLRTINFLERNIFEGHLLRTRSSLGGHGSEAIPGTAHCHSKCRPKMWRYHCNYHI